MKMPSPKEGEILRVLAAGRPLYGLQILAQSSQLKKGSLYVLLGRLEDEGFIEGKEVKEEGSPGMPRRVYRITGLGQRALVAWNARHDFITGALFGATP